MTERSPYEPDLSVPAIPGVELEAGKDENFDAVVRGFLVLLSPVFLVLLPFWLIGKLTKRAARKLGLP